MSIVDRILSEAFSQDVSKHEKKSELSGKKYIYLPDVVREYLPKAKFSETLLAKFANVVDGKFGSVDPNTFVGISNVEDVPINKIVWCQAELDKRGTQTNDLPHIAKYKNNYVIFDGNHRVVEELMNGKSEIKARVLDLNKI